MKHAGELPISIEGYGHAEWVLADYGDFLVHIFSPKARSYYELERVWRYAKEVPIPAAQDVGWQKPHGLYVFDSLVAATVIERAARW